jgi:ribonuclease P protein component
MIIIKKNLEYKSVYNCNDSISDYNLVMFIKKNSYGYNRFGFTAAKKIKKAVTRNIIRRRLKEIVLSKKAKRERPNNISEYVSDCSSTIFISQI